MCTGWFYVNTLGKGALIEKMPPQGPAVRHLLSDPWERAQPIVGGAIPGQFEQAVRSKPVSSTPHGLRTSSCLQVPALCELLLSLLFMNFCYMDPTAKLTLSSPSFGHGVSSQQ